MVDSIQATGDQGNGGNDNGNGKDDEFSSPNDAGDELAFSFPVDDDGKSVFSFPDDAGNKFVNGLWVFKQRLADRVAGEECQVKLDEDVADDGTPKGTFGSWLASIKIIQPKCFVIFDQIRFLLSYDFIIIIRKLLVIFASNLLLAL